MVGEVEAGRGPGIGIRVWLDGGGEGCASMISDVLDHALDV
eukprot:COSAG06_NODE_63220_length_263_cov_0.518293_2_plen_40_part_01